MRNEDLKWIGVDFDGTLAYSSYPDFEIQEPLPGAVEAMQTLHSEGWKIVIYTARPSVDYPKIEAWCRKHNIPIRDIHCGKPLFRYMIDDRNIEFDGDWAKTLSKIKK